MSDIAITVENLSKSYLIGHQSEREYLLRDIITREARNFMRKTSDLLHGRQIVQGDEVEEVWALKDVTFEVKQGEVLGIIGRNGAGKSTLLKILSRITEPTTGRVRLRGQVGSLLEVGIGFHPELTGRENIFLNGAILGMSRKQIEQKFNEIVAFAEIEKFLDTPVKRYSSGMYVRLAFAVAAHLEPDVLVVDEVLAVGDVEFQKKCLGKMSEVAGGGRTVLFVSHNLTAIARICKRALLLNAGHVEGIYDNVEKAVSQYLSANKKTGASWQNEAAVASNDYFNPLEVVAEQQPSSSSVTNNLTIRILGQLLRNEVSLNIAIGIYSVDGSLLFWTSPRDLASAKWMTLSLGIIELSVQVPTDILNEGEYYAELAIMLHNRKFLLPPGVGPKVYFSVPRKMIAHSEFWDQHRPGYLAPLLAWNWRQPTCPREIIHSEATS
jgi:lipopolysaccharide transport system ATP-binding protein